MNKVLMIVAALALGPSAARCAGEPAWLRLKDPLDVRTVKEKEPIFANRPYAFGRWTVVAAGQIEESPFKKLLANCAREEAASRHVRENLLFMQPDYVVYVPKQRREIVGDRYNDHFQVFDKPDGTLFAAWTQATKEGDVDQHICFSRSRDKGKTVLWIPDWKHFLIGKIVGDEWFQ